MKRLSVAATEEEMDKWMRIRGKTQEGLEEDLKRLRLWLNQQPHLPKEIDDQHLKSVVWGTKTMEKAQSKLDAFFSCRNTMQLILSDRDPLDRDFLEKGKMCQQFYLPRLTEDGSRVFMVRFRSDLGPEEFDHRLLTKRMCMIWDLCMATGQMAGYRASMFVLDAANVMKTEILAKVHPIVAKQTAQYGSKILPVKVENIVLFNMHPLAEAVFNTCFRPFMKKKMLDKMHITSGDHTVLKKFLPLDMLPSDYGGLEPSCQELHDMWHEELVKKRDWFVGEAEQRSNEKLRPGGELYSEEYVYGTFRNLNVD